jgi:hypothetical protein
LLGNKHPEVKAEKAAANGRYPCPPCSNSAGALWRAGLAEILAKLVLAGVSMLLLASLLQQFRQVGPRGRWIDALTLVPQWKFFGQDAVGLDPAWSDDWQVLARIAPLGEATMPEPWLPVLSPATRTGWHFAWNPHSRSRALLLAYAERLGQAGVDEPPDPTGLAYLSLLRACFEAAPLGEHFALQFAIVATRGRQERPVDLRFLSLWHVR